MKYLSVIRCAEYLVVEASVSDDLLSSPPDSRLPVQPETGAPVLTADGLTPFRRRHTSRFPLKVEPSNLESAVQHAVSVS